ncbi:glycerophosphodiester phosphodiesterase [Mariniluteicoccus endophyticus]
MNQRRRASDFAYFDAPFIPLAHRGGSLHEPNVGRENTVHAFAQAVALGYRWLETDVHATADGRLIAFHDDRLDRVSEATGLVADLPWSELEHVRIGGQDAIPTLDELFETFPDVRFNIDIKAPGAVEPLVDAIVAHRAHDRVCVGSFGMDRIRAFRRLMGARVATSVSTLGVAWTSFVPVVPALLNDAGVAFQMPITHRLGGLEVRVLTPAMVDRAHAAGKVVHVWTIDDPEVMHDLIDMGVDGIVTDRTDTLREVCRERGIWPG